MVKILQRLGGQNSGPTSVSHHRAQLLGRAGTARGGTMHERGFITDVLDTLSLLISRDRGGFYDDVFIGFGALGSDLSCGDRGVIFQ